MPLPKGLSAYEFQRTLEPSVDLRAYYHLRVKMDTDGVPKLIPGGMPAHTPISPEAFFGKPGPIEIEIGCGKGGFLVEYCERHPDIPFLGVEWEPEIAWFTASRLAKRPHLRHARVLFGDAYYFFRDFLPDACVSTFHMYFPDPWPKKRQRKNRLMNARFLEQVRRLATPGALFHWGTDYEEYDLSTRDLFSATPWLEMLDADAPPTEGIMTSFEKKYREEGRPIYRCVLRVRGELKKPSEPGVRI